MGDKTKQKWCNLSQCLKICQWGLNKMTRKLSEDSWSPGCDLDITSLCHKPACSLLKKKSRHYLVTRNAGSFTTSGPILTCPCCTNFVAICTDPHILLLTITTGNRRRQKDEALTSLHRAKSHFVGIRPIMYLKYNTQTWCFVSTRHIYVKSMLYLQLLQ